MTLCADWLSVKPNHIMFLEKEQDNDALVVIHYSSGATARLRECLHNYIIKKTLDIGCKSRAITSIRMP